VAHAAEAPSVVVELFTSQDCITCPPADRYLGELAQGQDILALAFHVDYWNYMGWTDPFAAKFASERQREYAKRFGLRYIYTPQMVINGAMEGIGSERATIASLIGAAANDPTRRVIPSLARTADGRVLVHLDAGPSAEPATIWLIGFDREHTTQVLRGENAGHLLKDFQVVRSYQAIGTWSGTALDLAVVAGEISGDGSVAVLVQLGHLGRIIGAAVLTPPTSY
jgi:hypothetical protein